MKIVANTISYIFHPLLLTTYLVFFLGFFFPAILGINPSTLFLFSLFILVITFVFPLINVALMMRLSGKASSFQMATRSERVVPFILISLIYCLIAGLFFYKTILGMSFNRILLVIAVLIVTGTVITFFFKISIHSLAMGGFVGILLSINRVTAGMLLYPVVISIVITGLVMSSRMYLNAHTLREVMSGALAGLVVTIAGMILLF